MQKLPKIGIEEEKLSPRRLKARKLAEIAVQTIVHENGTLRQIANKLPEQFAHHQQSTIPQSVYSSLTQKYTQEELKRISNSEEFDTKKLALKAKRKIEQIVEKTKPNKPTSPQVRTLELSLQLNGDLREIRENVFSFAQVQPEQIESFASTLIEDAQFEEQSDDKV